VHGLQPVAEAEVTEAVDAEAEEVALKVCVLLPPIQPRCRVKRQSIVAPFLSTTVNCLLLFSEYSHHFSLHASLCCHAWAVCLCVATYAAHTNVL
jgi:hypothetical protein